VATINVHPSRGPIRVPLLVPALFTGLFATVQLIIAPAGVAQTADACITEPRFEPLQGTHWYYRVDRTTNRKCWYLWSQRLKVQPAVAATTPPATSTSRTTAQIPPAQPFAAASAVGLNTQERVALFPSLPSWWISAAALADGPLARGPGVVADLKPDREDRLPVHAPEVSAAESVPPAPLPDATITSEQMLIVFAGALAFAGIAGRAISKNSAARRRRRAVRVDRRNATFGTAPARGKVPLTCAEVTDGRRRDREPRESKRPDHGEGAGPRTRQPRAAWDRQHPTKRWRHAYS
jgi:hypothetical protein